jgi:hypothetical protein
MKARTRMVLGISGMVIASSVCLFGTGCKTVRASYNPKTDEWSFEIKVNLDDSDIYDFTQGQAIDFDLDSREYEMISLGDREYQYFYNIDCLYQEETQLLVLRDDPIWPSFINSGFQNTPLKTESGYVFSGLQDRTVIGTFTPSFQAAIGLGYGQVDATLNLPGGSPIPTLDSYRWDSLSRQLFLIKDGISGSPDPIILNVSGEASDVFGYLYKVGIRSGNVSIDETHWSIHVDNNGQWADVYIGNELITSFELN